MDCYGIVVECCKRAGTPINDPFRDLDESVPMEEAMRIRQEEINVAEVDGPAVGRIVYAEMRGRSHVGYMVGRDKALHAVIGGRARVSPLKAFKNPRFYEAVPWQ